MKILSKLFHKTPRALLNNAGRTQMYPNHLGPSGWMKLSVGLCKDFQAFYSRLDNFNLSQLFGVKTICTPQLVRMTGT